MLHTLYGSHDAYFAAVVRTSKQNVREGYLLFPDMVQDMVDAALSPAGN
jgi:hypothetical protein